MQPKPEYETSKISNDAAERYFENIALSNQQRKDIKGKIIELIHKGNNHYLEIQNSIDGYTVKEIVECEIELIQEERIKEKGMYFELIKNE